MINRLYASGPSRGPTKIKLRNLAFCSQRHTMRSVVNAIRCEANEINRWREERLIGSRAVKMLRDLRRRARGLARHVAAANARAEVRARIHNWSL